jgi:RNA polymerase sigma-70 factor (ECF subfamily)
MMGDDDDAKDVLQDTFIDAFMKINTLKNPETFPAWIKRITINHCINALNSKERMAMQAAEAEDNTALEDVWTFEWDDREIKIKKIMQALDGISAGCRTVFNLYLFEGYDHKEIGEILSITASASKAQYSKAKMKIRKQLEKQKNAK